MDVHKTQRPMPAPGFTLVELLIVAVLLAIFAAAVVPNLTNHDDDARAAAAFNVVRSIGRQIDRNRDSDGNFPARVEVVWFQGYKLPANPLHPDHHNTIQSDNDQTGSGKWHPIDKTTTNHPFWYNPANGAIRIRVPRQATDAETLALYNRANGTSVSTYRGTQKG